MMRKVFLILAAVLLLSDFMWAAADVYYTSMDSTFNVDLEDSSRDGVGASGDYDAGEYLDRDIIGIVGVTGRDNNVLGANTYTFTFNLLDYDGRPYTGSGDLAWMYRSVSDPTYMIPFGIEFSIRFTEKDDGTNRTSNIVRLGLRDTSYDYQKDNPEGLDQNRIAKVDVATTGNTTTVKVTTPATWNAFWFDVVLVVPTNKRAEYVNNGTIQVAAKDDYQAAFDLNVEGTDGSSGSYSVFMTGYYGVQQPSGKGSVMFTVNQTANATNIDLDQLDENESVSIGNYFYTTKAYRDASYTRPGQNQDRPFKMFVSSSPDPLSNNNSTFYLIHSMAQEGNTSDALRIPFSIQLVSRDTANVGSQTFYGNDNQNSDKYLNGYYIFETTRQGENLNSMTWTDEGSINFVMGKVDKNNLVSGYYQANIYIHLYLNI